MTIHSYAIKIGEPEIERHFEDYVRKGSTEEAMAEILLGDPSYARRFRLPKHNGPVSMLREPLVAVRHAQELGIPGSKSAHSQRASYFQELFSVLDNAWQELVKQCVELFGKEGPLVSGIYRSHFPPDAKDRLRFLAHGMQMAAEARRLHDYLTKTRSPYFTW